MKIAILMLCHETPQVVNQRLSSPFFASPDLKVYVHYDASRSEGERRELEAGLPPGVQAAFVQDRVRCGWGSPELVFATQRTLRTALDDTSFAADYCVLISASCTPIRPLSSLQEFLVRRNGQEFIQAKDISKGPWVRGGLEAERYAYYFPFDWRTRELAFDISTKVQRRLGVRRPPPPGGLRMHFGSQWFCITRNTARHVVEQLDLAEMKEFLRLTWIPDEFAIQSIVANHVRPCLIAGVGLTYYEFTADGVPLVLDNGHFDHLMRQPFFFARKLAAGAGRLTAQLAAHTQTREYDLSYFDHVGVPTPDFQKWEVEVVSTGRRRSRIGTIGDPWRGVSDLNGRPYYVLYSASRAYARQLAAAARGSSGLPIFDYLFDPRTLVPAAERPSYRGVQVADFHRRDYDPSSFLYEVATLDPDAPTAFAVDPAQGGWISHFILWDANATLIDCDALTVTQRQRAESACRDMEGGREASLIGLTLDALAKQQPLPQDAFRTARAKKEHRCSFLTLRTIPETTNDPTLRAIRAAAQSVDPRRFYGIA